MGALACFFLYTLTLRLPHPLSPPTLHTHTHTPSTCGTNVTIDERVRMLFSFCRQSVTMSSRMAPKFRRMFRYPQLQQTLLRRHMLTPSISRRMNLLRQRRFASLPSDPTRPGVKFSGLYIAVRSAYHPLYCRRSISLMIFRSLFCVTHALVAQFWVFYFNGPFLCQRLTLRFRFFSTDKYPRAHIDMDGDRC